VLVTGKLSKAYYQATKITVEEKPGELGLVNDEIFCFAESLARKTLLFREGKKLLKITV
jgi:hypothetical protein